MFVRTNVCRDVRSRILIYLFTFLCVHWIDLHQHTELRLVEEWMICWIDHWKTVEWRRGNGYRSFSISFSYFEQGLLFHQDQAGPMCSNFLTRISCHRPSSSFLVDEVNNPCSNASKKGFWNSEPFRESDTAQFSCPKFSEQHIQPIWNCLIVTLELTYLRVKSRLV